MVGRFVGNVSCADTWAALVENPSAVLVDVRTGAEWAYVGVPDLSSLGRRVVFAEWQRYPTGEQNRAFVDEVAKAAKPDQPLYLICRSGVRSLAAAEILSLRGYTTHNVADGFEGPPDGVGHRGATAGWKAVGLPWRQT